MFKKILLPLLAANTFTVSAGGTLLADPGFENFQSGWRTYAKNGTAQVTSEPGHPGGKFLKLTGNSGKCFVSVKQLQVLPVSFRDEVRASVKMRGKARAYIRLYWVGKDGKFLKQYHIQGCNPTDKWQRFITIAQVPPQATGVIMALEKINKAGATDCDDAELTIRKGAVLSNGKMLASVNINLAGVIDSAALAGNSFQYTRSNRRGFGGGWFNVVVPAKRTPGEFGNIPVKVQILESGKKILIVQQIASGQFAGLELHRTYELKERQITMTMELINRGKRMVETDLRVQNFAPADRGFFSWPTPDWLRIFHQTGEPLNGLNSVTHDLLRAGWQARSYEKNKTALLFSYDVKRVDRTLSFISPSVVTLEWYYRPVKLAPGEKFVTSCTADILTGHTGYYADAIGKTQRAEAIVPKKMPPPPEDAGLPAKVRDTFMFAGGLGNLTQPEMGGMSSGYQYEVYKPFVMRVARQLTDAYFNTLGGVHLIQQGMHKRFYTGNSSRHEFGEFLRRHGVYFYLSRMMYHRRDVDPELYRKQLPKILSTWKTPLVQKFVHDYQDRLLFVNTGDEPLAVNTDVVLAAHDELKKIMPPDAPLLSIVNSSSVELMPYMPVYFADIYPIKRQNSAGADPWRVYTDLADKVRRAGDKPVWFLIQAFCGGSYGKWSIYAYPTAGELRLMANMAVAAGVRGISWYGVPGMSWSWVMNYFMNRMSVLSSSTMPLPGFDAIAECGRDLAGVGGLLVKSRPAAVPQNVALQCGEYADAAGFYRGSEIRLFAFKSPRSTIIMAVNQNPTAAASGTVNFPVPVWDFTRLTRCCSKIVKLQLPPGGAAYFYLGDDAGEIDLVFYSRYLREAARYRMAAERAKGNGIAVVDPDKFAGLPGRKAFAALTTEFTALEKAVAATPLGKALDVMNEIRQQLGMLDFELCRDMELLVTPEMERATPKYRRWQKHPDAGVQAVKDAVLADFRDANKLTDQLDAGEPAAKLLPEILQLQQRVKVDSARMRQLLNALRNGRKPDSLR